MIYLDASALTSLFARDAHTPALRAYIRRTRPSLAVSDFASAEFASATARRVRISEMSAERANQLLALHDGWTAANTTLVSLEPGDIRVATAFVRRLELGLRAPDALHLAACQRAAYTLLTFDVRQAAAARAFGIATADPSVPE